MFFLKHRFKIVLFFIDNTSSGDSMWLKEKFATFVLGTDGFFATDAQIFIIFKITKMQQDLFNQRKNNLINELSERLEKSCSETERKELKLVIAILHQYTYSNRLQKKGMVSHFLIDSSNLDYEIGDPIIMFDKCIS